MENYAAANETARWNMNDGDFLADLQPISAAYCALNALAFVLNAAHLLILSAMPTTAGQKNFFFFVKNLSLMDALMGLLRLSLSNKPTQAFMGRAHWFCVASGLLSHSLLLNMSSLLLLVSVDRIVALRRGAGYANSRFVVHFRKLAAAAMGLAFLMYILVGAVWHDKGFAVKGLGGCKFGTDKVPNLGLISVATILVNLLLIIAVYIYLVVLSKRTMAGARRSADNIVFTIGLIIAAKLLFWCPIMVTVVLRGLRVDCEPCEHVGLLTMSLNSIVNPLLYGLTNRSYRKFVTETVRSSILIDSSII